jgi:glycosyltransferase involved in cell wall biosynthesis
VRLLFLTPQALGSARSGGTIKSAALLEHLERRHEVDVACFAPPGEEWRRDAGRTLTIALHRPRSVGRLVESYARGRPLSVQRNRSRAMLNAVASLVAAGGHEALFIDGWLMAQYLPERFDGLTLLHEHNAEHAMWRRQADLERSSVRRAVVRAEAGRVRRYEAAILSRFDVVLAVSEPDRAALLALGARPPVPLVPNVPDSSLLDRPPLEPVAEPVLLFFGTLSWQPNVEGLTRFLRDGFPTLRRRVPGVRMVVAGSGASSALVSLVGRTPGTELVARVRDDELLYRMARGFVDVGLGGAGTRVKLLNALARGLPAAATSDAARGLEVLPDEHLLIADGTADMVDSLVRILSDDATWRRLSERGRDLVRTRYVPEVAFRGLDAALAGASLLKP